jgi:hypothetical protein
MARASSFGSRRITAWANDQKPRSIPRVVRLGRAANDNARQPNVNLRLLLAAIATAIAVVAMFDWRLI